MSEIEYYKQKPRGDMAATMALAELWRDADQRHRAVEEERREAGMALGHRLEQLTDDERRLVLDTLDDVDYVRPAPIQTLDVDGFVSKVAARAADRWGREPPAVLAERTASLMAMICGLTEKTEPRVKASRSFGVPVDRYQRSDGQKPATVRRKSAPRAARGASVVG